MPPPSAGTTAPEAGAAAAVATAEALGQCSRFRHSHRSEGHQWFSCDKTYSASVSLPLPLPISAGKRKGAGGHHGSPLCLPDIECTADRSGRAGCPPPHAFCTALATLHCNRCAFVVTKGLVAAPRGAVCSRCKRDTPPGSGGPKRCMARPRATVLEARAETVSGSPLHTRRHAMLTGWVH